MKVRVFLVSMLAACALALSGYYAGAKQKPVLLQEAISGKGASEVIRSLVESKCAGIEQPSSSFAPPEHGNIRGKAQFK